MEYLPQQQLSLSAALLPQSTKSKLSMPLKSKNQLTKHVEEHVQGADAIPQERTLQQAKTLTEAHREMEGLMLVEVDHERKKRQRVAKLSLGYEHAEEAPLKSLSVQAEESDSPDRSTISGMTYRSIDGSIYVETEREGAITVMGGTLKCMYSDENSVADYSLIPLRTPYIDDPHEAHYYPPKAFSEADAMIDQFKKHRNGCCIERQAVTSTRRLFEDSTSGEAEFSNDGLHMNLHTFSSDDLNTSTADTIILSDGDDKYGENEDVYDDAGSICEESQTPITNTDTI